ncbi:hypothetical protein, partial [Pseudomonas syringae group genomosp. 7]|uniref:hypothetical protein n=1 Tax=Pseudomonas syringae group genomosp. 7 TaxID=251699 RepID=UPI00376FF0D2
MLIQNHQIAFKPHAYENQLMAEIRKNSANNFNAGTRYFSFTREWSLLHDTDLQVRVHQALLPHQQEE